MASEEKNLIDEQRSEGKLGALQAAIDEGDASGVAEGDVFARTRKMLMKMEPHP
jgi:hypothetical protein